jgi:hypothetical protein
VNINTLKLFLFCLVLILLLYTILTKNTQTTIKYTTQEQAGKDKIPDPVETRSSSNIPDKITTEEVGSNLESILKTNTNDFYFVSTLGKSTF